MPFDIELIRRGGYTGYALKILYKTVAADENMVNDGCKENRIIYKNGMCLKEI